MKKIWILLISLMVVVHMILVQVDTFERRLVEMEEIQKVVYLGEFVVTAYNNTVAQCDNDPEITASGFRLSGGPDDRVIACNFLEFGDVIWIEGNGWFTVRDRMNKRYGEGHIDIYFGDGSYIAEAREFGRQKLLAWRVNTNVD